MQLEQRRGRDGSILPRLAVVGLAVLVCVRPGLAQSREVPRIFIGAGLYRGTDDLSDRMSRVDFEVRELSVTNFEGGVRIGRRASLGLDFFRPRELTTVMFFRSGQIRGTQREHVWLATARARLAEVHGIAVDAVGGGGAIVQHHEQRVFLCAEICVTSTSSMTNRAPAVMAGFDLPVRLAPFLAVAPTFRTYFLDRGEHNRADDGQRLSWPFQWRSSTRLVAGISGRVFW